jgi:hypothetical protein
MTESALASRMRGSVADFDVGNGGVSRLHGIKSNCDCGISSVLPQPEGFWWDCQLTEHTTQKVYYESAWSSTLQWTLWSLSLHRDT